MTRYVHYSTRPDDPRVPPRAMNLFAGGTGPLGVYAYPENVAHTFGADRRYVFTIAPTVPVVSTRSYSPRDLATDMERLGELVDTARPLRLWEKYKREVRHAELPFAKLWYVLSRLPNPHDDELPPGGSTQLFADPAQGRDLLVQLGHEVIDDRIGIIYSSEPQQAVFLTDRSFTIVDRSESPMARNPSDDVEAEYERWRFARDEKLIQIEGIFAVTPAIRGQMHGQPRMAIKSGELSDTKYGPIRVTFFGPDGPYGHVTKKTDREAAEAVLESMSPPYSAMADADVMEWTTTPEFERGSRIIAIIQAENMLRYLASRAGNHSRAFEIIRARGDMQFDRASLDELDHEMTRLAAAIGEMPRANPRIAAFVSNPAWVTGALASHYDIIRDKVPARWMPTLRHVEHDRNKLVGELTEFGCGAYGCVIATSDPETVLKVTSDETESEFAATLANDLVAPICVEYRLVVRLSARRDGAPIHLLWREAADHVGQIASALDDPYRGKYAQQLIDTQHVAAQAAYGALQENRGAGAVSMFIHRWLDSVRLIGRQQRVPELQPLAEGILQVWEAQHILFGDIHAGNIGYVPRRGAWVITDPGNIAVVDDERYY